MRCPAKIAGRGLDRQFLTAAAQTGKSPERPGIPEEIGRKAIWPEPCSRIGRGQVPSGPHRLSVGARPMDRGVAIMSVSSVGASSGAYSYLQSLLQQQEASSGNSVTGSDPVQELLAAFYPSGASPPNAATSTTAASGTGTGSSSISFSPDTMAALISIQGQQGGQDDPVTAQAQSLFKEIDTNGDGTISKSEFESVFGPNADMTKVDGLFNALDTNGDGTISQDELTSAVQQADAHHHHHFGGGGVGEGAGAGQGGGGGGSGGLGAGGLGDGGLGDLLSSTDLSGATSTTTSNSDGSTSTTITYADGSTVTMTTPASGSSGNASGNSTGSSGNSASDSNLLERLLKMQAEILSATSSQVAVTA
jgi:EF hand